MALDKNRFLQNIKQILEKRSGSMCSNPYCQAHTSGPHSDDEKSVNIGEAAHIRGANPGSARYRLDMTPAERSNITNGIWLCRKCAKLIDSDDKKYTVELLYDWKRNHESQVERKLNGTGWQREIIDLNLKPFENESAASRQIAIDKPEFWEYLLTVELLRAKISSIKKDFYDLKRGLIYRPSVIQDEIHFITWFRQKLHDLQALIKLFMVASTEDLLASWGKHGEPGDALEIKRAVDKIAFGCHSLLDWEIDVHFTIFPEQLESIKEKMEGWTEHFLLEIDRIPREISQVFDNPKPEGTITINLIFEPPKNIQRVAAEVEQAYLKT
ncbi:hypothetical protein H6F74_03965 [Trichocoleus sp. FACHB-90]|uniref:hypothetical protein n=1 Tax=Cyanophyceae TaxID=3028117 RepID=UPI0016849CED|nr:hypothetical protein [Trichocoleus sp. FACHB-90]MBD1925444.1 hypothetical protein [Trichocoleus sp. FACHB-90]